jgi:hypothetical protein
MTIAWVIADSLVRRRSAFESESDISKAFFEVVDNSYKQGDKNGQDTHLILKQLRIHDSRTAFRTLTDIAAKEDRLTGFQRLKTKTISGPGHRRS